MSGGVKAIEPAVKALQDAMLRLRYAQVPTVAAVSGMALGGGCELAAYCARRVASIESYIGLVEVGVGLIPGRRRPGLRRAPRGRGDQSAPDAYLMDFLKKYFMAAATAQVSKSAIEAQQMGYLLADDRHRVQPARTAVRGGARSQGDERRRLARAAQGHVQGRRARRHRDDHGASWSTCATAASSPRTTMHLGKTIAEVHLRRRRRARLDGRRGVDA